MAQDLTIPTSVAPFRTPSMVKAFTSATIESDDAALADAWLADRSAWDDQGIVADFENTFAAWNGSEFAFSFLHGRVALSACIYALGLQPGDEVIVPGYTCVAVPNSLRFAGITPVYADIELDTFGLDASTLETLITPRTRAVLLHHLFGLVSRDYDSILAVADRFGLRTIEDCAHSTGAEYRGHKVGTRGDVAIYSTQRSKVITTIEGGLAVTDDPQLADRLLSYQRRSVEPGPDKVEVQLRHVIADYHRFREPGAHQSSIHGGSPPKAPSITPDEMAGRQPADYQQRMPVPIAALGLNQLRKIDRLNEARRQNVKRWDSWCDERGLIRPMVIDESVPVFLRYPVLVSPEDKANPDRLMAELETSVGVWFATNIHPVQWDLVHGCPNADRAVRECINLPSLWL